MSNTIVVVGFGPGVSTAVAKRFGKQGFSVALLARNAERLEAGVAMLKAQGVTAATFVADAADPDTVAGALGGARAELGPIQVILWNAFGGFEAGDLLAVPPTAAGKVFDVAVVGLLGAVHAALPDLSATQGAVLVTNGAFADISPQTDSAAVSMNSMGVALANAAKHKLVGLLSQRLKAEGVYVGEVMIAGSVQGTAWATATAIDPAVIAAKFWELFQARSDIRARVS